MSALTIHDDLVHYEVLGRGKPIILLHSWLGSWHYWVPTMQQLAFKYRCYAIDLWGFGDSAKDPSRYTIDWQMELIDSFLDHMGIPKVVLVGHGLGAVVAARYAADERSAHRVHRNFIVTPPLFDAAPAAAPQPLALREPSGAATAARPESSPNSAQRPDGDSGSPEGGRMLTAYRESAPATLAQNPLKNVFVQGALEDVLRRAMAPGSPDLEKLLFEVTKTDHAAIIKSIEVFSDFSTVHDIMHANAATLILLGSDDGLLPEPEDALLTDLDSHEALKLLVMPNSHHFPMLDDQAQFVRLLKEFLEAPDVSEMEIKEEWRRRKR